MRLGFGGNKTKKGTKKNEGNHLTPSFDDPLMARCAKSLAEALGDQGDDIEDWGAVVCSWPAAALERVLPLLPAGVLLRLHAAFGGISPAAHDVLGDGSALDRAIQRDESKEPHGKLVDVFAGDAAGAPWTSQPPRGVAPEQLLFHQPHAPDTGTLATCQDLDAFQKAFDVFSGGLLRGLDFKKLGLVAAGGGVLACLAPQPEDTDLVGWLEARSVAHAPGRHHVEADARSLMRERRASPFCTSSDVDLFLVGCDETKAFDALRAVHETVLGNACCRVACVRSASALTVSAGFPRRHAQVVLRLYASPSAVLASFDVDACCFVYDGHQVRASARGLRALIECTNRVDPRRRSLTYESRLVKYALRGFSVYVPPRLYKPSAVDPRVYDLCLALRGHHPRCLQATPKTPETPAGRRLAAVVALNRNRDPVFGDGGEKPSGLVRLLVASRLYALRNASDAEAGSTKKKKGVDENKSLRDVLRRGWCYNRQKTPPMLPDEPQTFYSSLGPSRTESDFTAEDEAQDVGGNEDASMQPLYRCSLPWKPGWDAARIVSFVRARDAAALQAERMAEDGEHEWAPPRVRAVAQRSGGTLPSEYVASASFLLDDVVHVSALRWQAPSRSFYPVPIDGFNEGAHLAEGDPAAFYRCVVSRVGHSWPDNDTPTRYVKTRPSNTHHSQQMSYADFANLGLLPPSSYVGGEHATARVFEPGVVVRAALTDVEAGAVKVFRACARALAQAPAPVADHLGVWAQPVTATSIQGQGIPVDAETLLGNDNVHLHALRDLPASVKTRVNTALRKRCAGIASRILRDMPSGGPGKDEALKARHAEVLKTQEGHDAHRTWSDAHRRIVRKTSLELVEALNADARRALAAPIFDAYVDIGFDIDAVVMRPGAAVVGVCARCAAVLTANRKCARCKVANYCPFLCGNQPVNWATLRIIRHRADAVMGPMARGVLKFDSTTGSRDCQARHWDTHKTICKKSDAAPPANAAPLVRAVGRAANLEGVGALEAQMQGLAQILREGGAGAADMRRAVADMPQGAAAAAGARELERLAAPPPPAAG